MTSTSTATASPTPTVTTCAGQGTASLTPGVLLPGSSGNTLSLAYNAGSQDFADGGTVTFYLQPAFTTPPQVLDPFGAGFVNIVSTDSGVTIDAPSVSGSLATGNTITVQVTSMPAGAGFVIDYGDATYGSGMTAPSAGTYTVVVESDPKGTAVLPIGGSPSVVVAGATATTTPTGSPTASPTPTSTPAGGTGSAIVGPSTVNTGQTGVSLQITFTAAANGFTANGTVALVVPSPWPTAQTGSFSQPGYVRAFQNGTLLGLPSLSNGNRTITVTLPSGLAGGGQVLFIYGYLAGTLTAPAVGAYTFQVSSDPQLTGPLPIANPPVVNVVNQPTVTASPTATPAASFTSTGTPSGTPTWTATTSPTPSFSATASPSATATATPTGTPSATPSESPTYSASPTASPTNTVSPSPTVTPTFTPAFAEGTVQWVPSTVSQGIGTPMGFTFTAGSTAFASGKIVVIFPTAFTQPTISGSGPGRIRRVNIGATNVGAITASGWAVTFTVTSMPAGGQVWIEYGATAADAPGPSASASGGFTFTTYAAPTGSPLLPIVNQPTIVVQAASPTVTPSSTPSPSPSPTRTPIAGEGSAVLSPAFVATSATGMTFTLTFTAGTDAWINGQWVLTIPSRDNWSVPDPNDDGIPAYTTVTLPGDATYNTIDMTGSVITITQLSMAAGEQIVVTYGDLLNGSPGDGASVATIGGTDTFQVATDPQPAGAPNPQPIVSSPQVVVSP